MHCQGQLQLVGQHILLAHAFCWPLACLALQQKQVEQEEEMITNRLMKRLEQLKKEKQILAMEVRGL